MDGEGGQQGEEGQQEQPAGLEGDLPQDGQHGSHHVSQHVHHHQHLLLGSQYVQLQKRMKCMLMNSKTVLLFTYKSIKEM